MMSKQDDHCKCNATHKVQMFSSGFKQLENPSKIPIVVTVKAKGYPQLEYILHLFLKITISAHYNYLQVSHFLVKLEPVFL